MTNSSSAETSPNASEAKRPSLRRPSLRVPGSAHTSLSAEQVSALQRDVLQTAQEQGKYRDIPLDLIDPDPDQPRKTITDESLEELAASIREVGLMAPITVREAGGGRYWIVAGERRWRATKRVGLGHIPAIMTSADDSLLILQMQIIENNQRESVNAIENAQSFKRMVELTGGVRSAALKLGLGPDKLSMHIQILDADPGVRALCEEGVTQDVRLLYDLGRLMKVDPKHTRALIDRLRQGDGGTALMRKEVQASLKAAQAPEGEGARGMRYADAGLAKTEHGWALTVMTEAKRQTFMVKDEVFLGMLAKAGFVPAES